jgi:hypothetical protein
MGKVCKECGNYERLINIYDAIICYTDVYDKKNDEYVEVDSDTISEDFNCVECVECSSKEIIEIKGTLKFFELLSKHTDKQCKWHIKELPEKKQNKELYEKTLLEEV